MTKRIIALAGNPNSGKTTFFNSLTGSRQHVGNWPGKTVEKKIGKARVNNLDYEIVDLPGTYSLTSYSPEERIARDFILEENPDMVVNIIDATNLQRNLYLTMELIELGASTVVVLNMDNFARKKGIKINEKKLSELLKVPVFKVDAKNKDEVKEFILSSFSKYALKKRRQDFNYGHELEEHIERLSSAIKNNIEKPISYSDARWFAIKMIENDDEIIVKLCKNKKIRKTYSEERKHLKRIFKDDFDTIISDKRHGFSVGAVKQSVEITDTDRKSRSDMIDRFVMNKYLGIPIFLFVMFILFQLTFSLAEPFIGLIERIVSFLAENISVFLSGLNAPKLLISLIVDGIISGVGSVIVFLPNIFILFFIISILEDSGYFARAASIMDNMMHRIGLHGKSFIPLILGFGCNVPAIMATRSLERTKDRIITILINPFISCSARLPVYIIFVSAFFVNYQGIIIFSLYLLGILVAIFSALIFGKLFFKDEKTDFIMELPPYRIPTLSGAFIHTWERGKHFIYRAGTLILSAVIVIWFISNLPYGVEYASEESFAGMIGNLFAPLLGPLGFGNWQSAVALVFGIAAKEIVVGTFATLYGVSQAGLITILSKVFTPLSAYSFMVMILIYVPCIATIAVIRKETNSWKWTFIAVVYSILLSWIMAFIVYQGGLLLGLG